MFKDIIDPIWKGTDYYLVAHDFPEYLRAQKQVDRVFMNRKSWAQKCIETLSGMGKFSSDRTINEYARDIWNVKVMCVCVCVCVCVFG